MGLLPAVAGHSASQPPGATSGDLLWVPPRRTSHTLLPVTAALSKSPPTVSAEMADRQSVLCCRPSTGVRGGDR